MDSILIYFRHATPDRVELLLDALLPTQRNPWIVLDATGEVVLYIRSTQPGDAPGRPEGQVNLPFRPSCGLVVGVSVRHSGDAEVRSLLESLLMAFDGVAIDGFTNHPWLLDEIRQDVRKDGHTFFDADGWWEAARRRPSAPMPNMATKGVAGGSNAGRDPWPDTLQELSTLLDNWCARRELRALRIILPAWPPGTSVLLTDDAAMLRDALRHLRAMGKNWLPAEEYDTVNRAVANLTRAIDRV